MLLQAPRLKIHGCMKSGTNILEFFLRHYFNTKPIVNDFAWKHGRFCKRLKAAHIVIYKDCYAWLKSMCDFLVWFRTSKVKDYYMKSDCKSLKEFIRMPFFYKMNSQVQDVKNPTIIYKVSYQSWCEEICQGPKIFVRYLDLLTKPESTMDAICDIVSTKCGGRKILFPEGEQSYEGFQNRTMSEVQNYERMKYYVEKRYMESFDDDDMDYISKMIPQNLLAAMDELTIKV